MIGLPKKFQGFPKLIAFNSRFLGRDWRELCLGNKIFPGS